MEASQKLKTVGLKVTSPRLKILQILENASEKHMSAEDVYRLLVDASDDVGLATVYRVLTQFEEAALVIRHYFEGGHSVFELASGPHHDHMVCIKCNKVEEFVDETIESRQEQIAKDAQFTITYHALTIYGICSQCSLDAA